MLDFEKRFPSLNEEDDSYNLYEDTEEERDYYGNATGLNGMSGFSDHFDDSFGANGFSSFMESSSYEWSLNDDKDWTSNFHSWD